MSQKGTRKTAVTEEKDKTADSPVKDMKKKLAANAEKEKQAEKQVDKGAEKLDKSAEKGDKATEKKQDKTDKKPEVADKKQDKTDKKPEATDKKQEKTDKKPEAADKKQDKTDKKPEAADKKQDKTDKKPDAADKKQDKVEKKPEAAVEKKDESKKKEDSKKDDKAEKADKQEHKPSKAKHNGSAKLNGTDEHNGTASAAEEDDVDDEMFPELAYDDTSDPEFEPDTTPRSLTRRSQAKATRTPETPRPASDKLQERDGSDNDSKDKAAKMKEDAPSTDRKLRSSDSPKPDKRQEATGKKVLEVHEKTPEAGKKEGKENGERKTDVEIVIEIDGDDEPRKTDTNYSKSRVKVSPYRRSLRLADSMIANYTGNNTTMEMDITESSVMDDTSLDDGSFLSGIRNIRGRRSYKLLKDLPPRPPMTARPNVTLTGMSSVIDQTARPTGTVVGRKRKPESSDGIELATDAVEAEALYSHGKRMRLLDRLFRRADRSAQIVGINSDLPLTAPVASTETIDPESLKPHTFTPPHTSQPEAVVPTETEKESKKCIIM